MARTYYHDTAIAHAARPQTQGQTCQRRRDILEALISGKATVDHWSQLPESIATAIKSGHVIELEPSGEFIIHGDAQDELELIQDYQDVEMTDAAPLSPEDRTRSCTSRHSRTRGVCPVDRAPTLGTLEGLRGRHRVHHSQSTNPRRFRAFHAIKDRTKSAFGNGSSRLAHECTGEQELARAKVRRLVLDSWKVAPVLKTLQDANIQGLSCEKDPVTGTSILVYLQHGSG